MIHDADDMVGYYAQRAEEYEEVYQRDDPGRRAAQERLGGVIRSYLKGLDVLELACGTGHWTQKLSETAKRIVATDINPEVMEVAQRRKYRCEMQFRREDVYNLSFERHTFTGGMAHFLFSHIPKSDIHRFLVDFHRTLQPGAKVVISEDVRNAQDTPIRKPRDENTYSERQLLDGTNYLILKNFYEMEELVTIFREYIPEFSAKNVYRDAYYWYVTYSLFK